MKKVGKTTNITKIIMRSVVTIVGIIVFIEGFIVAYNEFPVQIVVNCVK